MVFKLLLITFVSVVTYGATSPQGIHWHVDPSVVDKKISKHETKLIRRITDNAAKCINQALQQSGSSLKLNHELKTIKKSPKSLIQRQRPLEYFPFETKDGALINGIDDGVTSTHIFLSNIDEQMHYVPKRFSKKAQDLYKKIRSSDPNFLKRIEDLENYSESTGDRLEFMKELLEYNIGQNGEDRFFSNVLYLSMVNPLRNDINLSDLEDNEDVFTAVLAHEMLHSWGGLEDTYDHSEEVSKYDESLSMMSIPLLENMPDLSYKEKVQIRKKEILERLNCKITSEQARDIEKYQSRDNIRSTNTEGFVCAECLR